MGSKGRENIAVYIGTDMGAVGSERLRAEWDARMNAYGNGTKDAVD